MYWPGLPKATAANDQSEQVTEGTLKRRSASITVIVWDGDDEAIRHFCQNHRARGLCCKTPTRQEL